jgi:hypothetical protein
MKTILHSKIGKMVAGLIAAFFLIFTSGTVAQEVIVRLNLPPLDQFTVNDLYNAQIINNSGKSLKVFLKGSVTDDAKGLLFEGRSAVFTLEAGFNGLPAFSLLEPVKISYSNKQAESYVLRTGTIPPGTYFICLRVIDASTQEELADDCIQTEMLSPMPPELILPVNESTVVEVFPIFSWMPPAPQPVKAMIIFMIRIVELLPHQTVAQALASNPAWYLNNQVTATTFQYPPDARPLEKGKRYAWQVTAFTQTGEQIASPSEPFSFQYSADPETDEPLYVLKENPVLLSELLDKNGNLTFTWELRNKPQEPYTFLFALYEYDLSAPPPSLDQQKLVYSKDSLVTEKLVAGNADVNWNPEKGYTWIVYMLTKDHYLFPDTLYTFTRTPKQFDFGDAPDDPHAHTGYHTYFNNDGARHHWFTKAPGSHTDIPHLPGGSGSSPTLFRGIDTGPIIRYDTEILVSKQAWLGRITPADYVNGFSCDPDRLVDYEQDTRLSVASFDNMDEGVWFDPEGSYCEDCHLYHIDVKFVVHPGYDRSNKLMFAGWIDWKNDGDWDDTDPDCPGSDRLTWQRIEGLYNTTETPAAGSNAAFIDPRSWGGKDCAVYRFYFYSSHPVRGDHPARFRVTPNLPGDTPQSTGATYQGEVVSGEVEDYMIPCRNTKGYKLEVISPVQQSVTGFNPVFSVRVVAPEGVIQDPETGNALCDQCITRFCCDTNTRQGEAHHSAPSCKLKIKGHVDDVPVDYAVVVVFTSEDEDEDLSVADTNLPRIYLKHGGVPIQFQTLFDPPLPPNSEVQYTVQLICGDKVVLESRPGSFRTPELGTPVLKLLKPYPHEIITTEPEFRATISGMDSETEVILYCMKKLGLQGNFDKNKISWSVCITPEGSKQPVCSDGEDDIVFLYPEYNPLQQKAKPSLFPVGGAILMLNPKFDPPANTGSYKCLIHLSYDGKIFLTSDSSQFRITAPPSLEPVETCHGLGEWNLTIVSDAEVWIDANGTHNCGGIRNHRARVVTRAGCRQTPAGSQWIDDPGAGAGTTADPKPFIRCFRIDGCIRSACIEYNSTVPLNIAVNGRSIGISVSCRFTSFAIPVTFFNPLGDNTITFTPVPGERATYTAVAFALHIAHSAGTMEADQPVVRLISPTTPASYITCVPSPGTEIAPAIPVPSASSADNILIDLNDASGIVQCQILMTHRTRPASTDACATFSEVSNSAWLVPETDFTSTAATGGVRISIPLSRLYSLIPSPLAGSVIELDFFVTDGACVPNTRQQKLIFTIH